VIGPLVLAHLAADLLEHRSGIPLPGGKLGEYEGDPIAKVAGAAAAEG
jgi:hypothetical protein